MDTTAEVLLKKTERAREELLTYLKHRDSTFSEIEDLLKKYQSTCIDFIFLDFGAAVQNETEEGLWRGHLKINTKFRECLAKYREGEGKKKHVERRKMEKQFLDFVKSSMRFYRGYIQRLASHFAGVPKILEIARKFSLDTLSVDPSVDTDEKLRELLLKSCYSTLIRLGDLSRYRETELVSKDRNWGPAKGYYDLARELRPESWESFNALAVMALKDDDHFRAVYYLHRAVAVPARPPTAIPDPSPEAASKTKLITNHKPAHPPSDNLEVEFRKILKLVSRKQPVVTQQTDPTLSTLKTKFVIFHANCFMQPDFLDHETAETGMLDSLAEYMDQAQADGVLSKICLINIAAFHRARKVLESEGPSRSNVDRYNITRRLNIQTLLTLLQTLLVELQRLVHISEAKGETDLSPNDLLTPTVCQILPSLRQYSSWLLEEANELLAQEEETCGSLILQFWALYADVLNALASNCPVLTFPNISYLLDEDVDTLGFEPLMTKRTVERYESRSGVLKSKPTDLKVNRRQPKEEFLFRIREFVRDGLKFAISTQTTSTRYPIVFGNNRFVYDQTFFLTKPRIVADSKFMHVHARSSVSLKGSNNQQPKSATINSKDNTQPAQRDGILEAAEPSVQLNEAMREMVDDLVETDTSDADTADHQEFGPRTPTLNPISGFQKDVAGFATTASVNVQELVRQMRRSPSSISTGNPTQPLPLSLPTIWTPRPGETTSRPGTSHRMGPMPIGSTPPARSSGVQFQEAIAAQQQQLQLCSSPHQDSSMPSYGTPTGQRSMPLGGLGLEYQPPLAPWQNSSPVRFGSSGSIGGHSAEEMKSPEWASFGAIGEKVPRGKEMASKRLQQVIRLVVGYEPLVDNLSTKDRRWMVEDLRRQSVVKHRD